MTKNSRLMKLAGGAACAVIGIALVIVAGDAADRTSDSWPGFVVLAGVIVLFAGFALIFGRRMLPWGGNRYRVSATDTESTDYTPPATPGWFRDPESPSMRFWDGAAWTDQRAPLPQPAAPPINYARIAIAVAAGIALFAWLFGRG